MKLLSNVNRFRYRFVSDSQNNDFGFIFYASATWGPNGVTFPFLPGLGGPIWDEKAEKALYIRREKWYDAPHEEQARIFAFARETVIFLADFVVNRIELRIDAAMCSVWAVQLLVLSAFASIQEAEARQAAASARAKIRNQACTILSAACRRTQYLRIHSNQIIIAPSLPQQYRRFSVAIQVQRALALLRTFLPTF